MLEAGQEIELEQGVYRLVTPLNHGNQGQVWRARLHDGTEYAFKTLRPHDDPQVTGDLAQRLSNEIAFLRMIPDPEAHFIIPCLDAGEWRDGEQTYPAFVMPCLPRRLANLERAPDGATLLRWAMQIAEALRWLHAQTREGRHPIHRDIKPDNILLTEGGELRLIDFGIATMAGATGTLAHRDAAYFAPEQRLPIQPGACAEEDLVFPSPKSDLYCLGLILFRMTIGRGAVPKAQLRLRNEQTRLEHIAKLATDGRGLIGQIGGLEAKERAELRNAAIDLLQGGARGTLVQRRCSLPNLPQLAEVFADQVALLLAPAPEERPDAAAALTAFERLQEALAPGVERIALSVTASEVAAEEDLVLRVEVEGWGLPAHGRWLQLSVDGEPLSSDPEREPQEEPFVSGIQHWDFRYRPSIDHVGNHRAAVMCQVAGKTLTANIEFLVEVTPDQLWAAGGPHRLKAVRLDPRTEWLDHLMREARKRGDREQLLGYLRYLHGQLPDNTIVADQIHNLERTLQKREGWVATYLRPLVYALPACAIALGSNRLFPEIAASHDPGDDDALAVIEYDDRRADYLLLHSRDPSERAQGYALAEAAAERGDVNAMIWLAYRHDLGDGVSPDARVAARWYAAAAQAGDQVAAERLAELRR